MMRLYKYQRKHELEKAMQRGVEEKAYVQVNYSSHTVMLIFESGPGAEEFLNTWSRRL